MERKIKTLYVTHHSHTDIGYTDLQERVIETQINYIRTVLALMQEEKNAAFRWNCETLYCVERFWETAAEHEKQAFCALAAEGRIGLSANYLNFNDLLDSDLLKERLAEWQARFAERGITLHTAMMADINGISMGCRDAMLACGVDFLLMNIHCHHGMYPLYQNQTAFYWENAAGQRMLVWNGEHYNLGNVLGLKPNRSANFMMQNHLGAQPLPADPVEALHLHLSGYLDLCEENGYPYDFTLASVSGVFSDNAPPETEILRTIEAYNERYGHETTIQMVSLGELHAAIAPKLTHAPVYRGDLNDWWANGVGSTPYAVKHYKAAVHRYHLCERLDTNLAAKYPDLVRTAQDNLLLYAEHTWGHSSTITNPYDTMVLDLDMRKNSYASKAHEAASLMLNRISMEKGDILRYYNTSGTVRVCNPSHLGGDRLIEFYIESPLSIGMDIRDEAGHTLPCQVSPHPRGRRISFVDSLAPHEEKTYTYQEQPNIPKPLNSRKCYVGAERVRDIVNDYDPVSYRMPYGFENRFFRLSYRPHKGVTALVDKRTGRDLLGQGVSPLFTPLREATAVRPSQGACPQEQERRILGRNIRGEHAQLSIGELMEIECLERGEVFTQLRLRYALPGTLHADVVLKLYEALPRIDFTLELGKTLSTEIESIFLPLTLNFENAALYARKGAEAYRPGVDQLPGSGMEYTMSDDGLAYIAPTGGALIAAHDVPLFYMGQMRHHPIRLCDGRTENNLRPVYSWVMNNTWETNFKMDLSGFGEFRYTLWLTDETDPERAMDRLREQCFEPYVLMIS